jgi:broad specificity phosphatase PhoE
MHSTKIIFSVILILLVSTVDAQNLPPVEGTKIFLVRHAEKDTGNNPSLLGMGKERAGDLYRLLQKEEVGKIFFSRYHRTRQTADSLYFYSKPDTFSYKADINGDGLVEAMRLTATPGNKRNILIIGHSNTIPAIIRKLGVEHFELKEIPDNEYDNLYIITYSQGKAILQKLKYGKRSTEGSSKMMPLQ